MQIKTILGARVLVKVLVEKVEDLKADDLVVAPQSINPNYFKGEVVQVGPLATAMTIVEDGTQVEGVAVGQKVCFLKYGYEDMGDGQYIVEEAAILCTYED